MPGNWRGFSDAVLADATGWIASLCYDPIVHHLGRGKPFVDNRLALQLIRAINDDSLPMQVEWLSPIIVAMLAAAVASDPRAQERVREQISLSLEQQA